MTRVDVVLYCRYCPAAATKAPPVAVVFPPDSKMPLKKVLTFNRKEDFYMDIKCVLPAACRPLLLPPHVHAVGLAFSKAGSTLTGSHALMPSSRPGTPTRSGCRSARRQTSARTTFRTLPRPWRTTRPRSRRSPSPSSWTAPAVRRPHRSSPAWFPLQAAWVAASCRTCFQQPCMR